MKISVLIPCFNGERWIAQCLDNVMCQTWRDLEVIVIDDGSTDRTAAIVTQNYPSVRLISQANQGASVSRNNGVRVATGEWIHFLDADDLICRDYYERMMAALSGLDESQIDMIFGDHYDEPRRALSLRFAHSLVLTSLEDKIFMTNVSILGYSVRYLVRRSMLIDNNLQFESGRLFEDIPFTLEAVARARAIVTAPGAEYRYMKRGSSMTHSRNRALRLQRKRDWSWAKSAQREFFERHGIGSPNRTIEIASYKILGIPMLTRKRYNDGSTKWFLIGLQILRYKYV